jgi:hypothetical protein
MHRRVREILDAAGMVEIEMCEDDMAHIGGSEPKTSDLPQSGIGLAQLNAVGGADERVKAARVHDILEAEPGVDEHEPDFGLNQKAVADEFGRPQHRALAVP